MAKPVKRCPWARAGNGLYQAYHDREWGVPVHDDQKQFEFLTLESAQAGLSWATILNKREGYRKAFAGFDPQKVARFTLKRIERLMTNREIVRNRLKINAAVTNAQAFLKVQEEFDSFDVYIWQFVDGDPIPEPVAQEGRCAGHFGRIREAQQGSQATRVQVCRQYDCLCAHAGGGPGQRSPCKLLSPSPVPTVGLKKGTTWVSIAVDYFLN